MPDQSPADGLDAERCVGPFEWSRAESKKDGNCTQLMESWEELRNTDLPEGTLCTVTIRHEAAFPFQKRYMQLNVPRAAPPGHRVG